MEQNKKQHRNTILLLALLLLLALGGILAQRLFAKKDGATAIVQQRGKVIAELSLSEDTELVVDDTIGGTNKIVVADGAVSVAEANCPDLTCVHTGAASRTGDVIACLPHSLIITVSESGTDAVDSTAW